MAFNGTFPHETKRVTRGLAARYSVIFFMAKMSWNAPAEVLDAVCDVGANPPRNVSEATKFSMRFKQLCDGEGYCEWPLPNIDDNEFNDTGKHIDLMD